MKILVTLLTLHMAALHGPHLIYNFDHNSNIAEWKIVNDVVMGGRSQSTISLNAEGRAIFAGNVSLENNGGFASVRYNPPMPIDSKAMENLVVKLKGDGNTYQVRIKASADQEFSYGYELQTSAKFTSYEIPLAEMSPTFRGQKLTLPNYKSETITEIAFLISNKKAQSFALQIDKIYLH